MDINEFQKAIYLFINVLNDLEIPYYIGGSVASSVFGLPRSTMDVDIIADINTSHVKYLVLRLKDEYYIDEGVILQAINRKSSFNIIHFETMMKVDVFLLKDRPYDKEAFNRKQLDNLGQFENAIDLYFSSPEDIILSKLEWFKMGGGVSERQWKDLIGVLKVQGRNLNLEYLKKWAIELRFLDLLQRALAEISDSKKNNTE